MNLTPEMLFVIFAIVFGVACNGAIKLFYKYNTLLVIAYIVFLFPIALAHSLLMGFLFGDILAVTPFDIAIIWGGGLCVLIVLIIFWKSLFAATVSLELAQAEGMNPEQANIIFMLLLAAVIAISMKIVGVLLITSMLIFPAAIARRFATGPEQIAILSAIVGIIAVFGGLLASLQWDTPAGPSIVVASSVLFILTVLPVISIQMLGVERNKKTNISK